jgi:ketosteroid isomerase-like protein
MKYILILSVLISLGSCHSQQSRIEQSKKEIIQTEGAFAKMAADSGIQAAFTEFADDNAVIRQNKQLLKGKADIYKHYGKEIFKKASLQWTADFVDAAASGDLGYTYGHYIFIGIDSLNKADTSKGYFHTVWKKQTDGKWKFVWD